MEGSGVKAVLNENIDASVDDYCQYFLASYGQEAKLEGR